ncbi:AraC family transcriptional regulator [Actinomadura barringtoniae]|nr:AraC family transcriptional regulator [Actinomadura barringtoniae]
MRIQGDTERPATRVRRAILGQVSIDRLNLDYAMSYDVDPLGKVCLCTVSSGTIAQQVAGQDEEVFGPGDTVLFTPPDKPYKGEIRRSCYDIIMLDPALLAQVAGQELAEPIDLGGHRPVSKAAADNLVKTIAYLRGVLQDPELAGSPLIVSAASQLLAASVLTAFPDQAHADERDQTAAQPETVRRAAAFIDDHADAAITLADIAAAAKVGTRALQYGFRQHLDTTPMAYLRRVRLVAAHADLVAAQGEHTTVTAIATRWGFHHPGRFATTYQEVYGCPPSRTLHA